MSRILSLFQLLSAYVPCDFLALFGQAIGSQESLMSKLGNSASIFW
jgi:hypothetical protein